MTRAFISYSRKDLAFVERLAEDLQAAGLEVWYDLSGLDGGTRWGREIQNSIETSLCFVVVLSPNSIDSEWVEKEFMYANSLKKKIIPLLYQPCKTPMWFINLHFIDVQGDNYDRNFWIILKAMGVKAGEGRAKVKPASATPVMPAAPAPLPLELAAQEKARQAELARQQKAAEEKQRQEAQERLRREEEEKARQEQLARQQRAAEEGQRQQAQERLRKEEEEKAWQEQLARQKSAAEEKSRLEAEERLRQKEELQVRRAALELERSRQEQQKRELRAAEIARLQQEIEAALAGEHWERARLLISQMKSQGAEGRALAGSLRKRLPRMRIPGWVWAIPALLVGIALLGLWARATLGAARLAPTPTPTTMPTNTTPFTPTLPPTSTPTITLTPTQTPVPSPTLTPTTGTVSGSVWWADKPFEGVVVDVCSNWLFTCKGIRFSDITKADGSFTITGVAPGEYQLITKYPGQAGESRYFPGENLFPLSITVSAGETAGVDRINICKTDLYLYAPILNGKVVKFSWKPYPGATDYVLKLSGENNTWKDSWSTNGLAFETSLNPGNYQMTVFVFGPACTQGIVNFTVP
jgi:actin-related protein